MAKKPTFIQIRTAILFVGGLAGVAYETLVAGAERPTLLILFAAMLGLPLFLRTDEKLRSPEPAPPPGTTPKPGDGDG